MIKLNQFCKILKNNLEESWRLIILLMDYQYLLIFITHLNCSMISLISIVSVDKSVKLDLTAVSTIKKTFLFENQLDQISINRLLVPMNSYWLWIGCGTLYENKRNDDSNRGRKKLIYRSVAEEEVQLSKRVHFVQIETIVAHGAHRIRHGHRLQFIQDKTKQTYFN